MKAEIVPVGTEILMGNIADTNSSFLASQLPLLGIDLYFVSTVGDNRERLVSTLRQAWKRADVIITTGGLGPTQDDITREALGELLREELKVDEKLWQELRGLFRRYPGKIPESNVKQATLIPSAQIISNRIGTAPGWWIEKDDHIVVALPGPPDEMEPMWQESVLPKLEERATGAVIVSKTIKTFGLPESQVDELVAHLSKLSNPTLAPYIHSDGVYLRITAKAKNHREARHLIARSEEQVRSVLSHHIWGVDDDTLGSVTRELLKAKKLTLATMESCTDGLLCSTMAGGQEGYACFKGGLLACCDEARVACGMDPSIIEQRGKERAQGAKVMADTVRKSFKADIGLGVDGDLNADRSSGEAFIGLSGEKFEQTFTHRVRGNRCRMQQRTVHAALFDLRRVLLGEVQCT